MRSASVLRRPCLSAQRLLEFAAKRGLAPELALAGTGLELPPLKSVGASIDSRDELALIASVLRQLGNPPDLGLAMGQRYRLTAYGLWGFALLSAPTLRSALETGLRYLDLTYSYLQLRLRNEGGQTRVIFDASEIPEDLRGFLLERDTAALVVIRRELRAAQHGFSGNALPDMETMAAELHLSSRTLRRRLQREGSNYRDLIEEVRQTLAEELLGGTDMKIDEAAARLGYSEAASFLHARKRWRRRVGVTASASRHSSP